MVVAVVVVMAAADGDAVEQIVGGVEAVPQELIVEVGAGLERLYGGPADGWLMIQVHTTMK